MTGARSEATAAGLDEKSQALSAEEPTLAEELDALAENDHVEMTNLQEKDTGIPGVVFISTAMGSHGPRVKYYLRAGRGQPSFSVSISEKPQVLASSLRRREVDRVSAKVVEWVRVNRTELLRFWSEGDSFSLDEVVSFVAALKKV